MNTENKEYVDTTIRNKENKNNSTFYKQFIFRF